MSETADRLYEAVNLATFAEDPDARDCVGCIVYDTYGKAIGSGWNHTLDHSPMRVGGKAVKHVVHAETVAIQEALANLDDRPWYRLKAYCTKEPCIHCLVQLANANVSEVHYIDAIPYEKSARGFLQHFPSLTVYKEYPDQLPLLLRALGVRDHRSTEPVPRQTS